MSESEAPVSRRAIVTGASGGIGTAICERLLADGMRVLAVDVEWSRKPELPGAGDRLRNLVADLSGPEGAVQAVEAAITAWGGVDIVVNNAAFSRYRPLLEVSPEEWDRAIAVNLSGYFYLAQRAARDMVTRRFGRLVSMASVNSFVSEFGAAPYVASKGGVAALARAFAVELGDLGITSNAIAPGPIEHARNTAALHQPNQQAILDRIPAGRTGAPRDVAGLVSWLCSDDASYVNGATLVLDGGLTARL